MQEFHAQDIVKVGIAFLREGESGTMNIPVLLYHSVSDTATPAYRPWCISPAEFDRHMAFLRNQGYQSLTVTEMVSAMRAGGNNLPDRPVVITFDDGLADFSEGALPILKRYGFSSTLYVTTDFIGTTSGWLSDLGEGKRPMLTWDQLKSLENVEIGAHSQSHPQLDLLPASKTRGEIVDSKNILEQHLNRSIETFAFPHGYHSKTLIDGVKMAGYSSACIVGHSMASDRENPLAIPRIIITSDVTVETLARFLTGDGLRRRGAVQEISSKVWRAVRWGRSILAQHPLPLTQADHQLER